MMYVYSARMVFPRPHLFHNIECILQSEVKPKRPVELTSFAALA
jgi:hypothetical protein